MDLMDTEIIPESKRRKETDPYPENDECDTDEEDDYSCYN